jgi:hypothetical protein
MDNVKYTAEQMQEDILQGTKVIGNEVDRLLSTIDMWWEKLRPAALLWSSLRVRVGVWLGQTGLLCLWLIHFVPWWVLVLSVVAGGAFSAVYELYCYKRAQLVQRVTDHVNAVYDRKFDKVWTELMMVKIWKVCSSFPMRGKTDAVADFNSYVMEPKKRKA